MAFERANIILICKISSFRIIVVSLKFGISQPGMLSECWLFEAHDVKIKIAYVAL